MKILLDFKQIFESIFTNLYGTRDNILLRLLFC